MQKKRGMGAGIAIFLLISKKISLQKYFYVEADIFANRKIKSAEDSLQFEYSIFVTMCIYGKWLPYCSVPFIFLRYV